MSTFPLLQGGVFDRTLQLGAIWSSAEFFGSQFLTMRFVSKNGREVGQATGPDALFGPIQIGFLYDISESVLFPPAPDAYVPIGIISDESIGVLRGIYGIYRDTQSNGERELVEIREVALFQQTPFAIPDLLVWDIPIPLPRGVEHSMRVVTLAQLSQDLLDNLFTGINDPLPVLGFIYYVLSSGDSSRLYVVPISPPSGFIFPDNYQRDQPPQLVAEFDFKIEDRIYVVRSTENWDRVIIYLGDGDSSPLRRTTVLVHEPLTNTVVRPPKVLIDGASPFPRSYAAAAGRSEWNLPMTSVLLETENSRDGGGAVDLASRLDSPHRISYKWFPSGSEWLLCSFVTDGYNLLDQQTVDHTKVGPYLGGGHAVNSGSWNRVRAWPTFLGRLDLPLDRRFFTSFEPGDTIPDQFFRPDVSSDYMLHCSYGLDTPGDEASSQFVFRKAPFLSAPRPIFGANYSETQLTANSTGLPMYVAGSIQLAHVGGVNTDETYYNPIGLASNRRDSWRLDDDTNPYGWPGPVLSPFGSPLDQSLFIYEGNRRDAEHDWVNGCKAAVFEPDRVFMVAWYTHPISFGGGPGGGA